MTRVTQEGLVQNTYQRLRDRLSQLESANVRLASGKEIRRPSDDPAQMNRALGMRAQLKARDQEARNAADGLTMLNAADSKLQSVVDRLHRARDLAVGAVHQDADARQAARAEIVSIRDELVGIANAKIDGKPLFAGFSANDAIAFDDGNGEWVYQGDDGTIQRRVSEEDVVDVAVTAEDVFGEFPAAADGPNGDNVLAVLDRVISQLDSGDVKGLSDSIDAIDTGLRRIGDQQSKIGVSTNRIESAMRRNSDEVLSLRGELAEVEDVDLAEAVMELQTQEVAYQATLSALSRALQPSLVDFIR